MFDRLESAEQASTDFFSNMSLNYLSLADVNALKVILETYDLSRKDNLYQENYVTRHDFNVAG